MGGPTSSYAAASMVLEFTGAHKPPHPATKCVQQGEDTIEGKQCVWPVLFLLKKNLECIMTQNLVGGDVLYQCQVKMF
jgi:hypothetical protein